MKPLYVSNRDKDNKPAVIENGDDFYIGIEEEQIVIFYYPGYNKPTRYETKPSKFFGKTVTRKISIKRETVGEFHFIGGSSFEDGLDDFKEKPSTSQVNFQDLFAELDIIFDKENFNPEWKKDTFSSLL